MKKYWILVFVGLTTLGFAQYGSSNQNGNRYPSYGYQQNQSGSPCEMLKNSDPDAYAFAQQLSPIHQNVFCSQFTKVQQRQAMALAGSATQNMQGQSDGTISPDMAVEVVMQTARYTNQGQLQQQQQPQPYSYPNQNGNGRGRYSN